MKKHIFAVAGGDMRFVFLAEALAGAGYETLACGFGEGERFSGMVEGVSPEEAFGRADAAIMPLPCTDDGKLLHAPLSPREIPLAECLFAMRPGTMLMGGMLPRPLVRLAEERGVEAADYFAREEFAVKNAVPTAEGALAIAINELPTTIAGRRVLIIGYGRIARVLTRMLKALGAEVTVAARKCSDRAWAETEGARAVPLRQIEREGAGFELVYNTAPAPVLGRRELTAMRRDCLLIDLASKPGGVDTEAARELGLRAVWALSLPGKTAPKTAGEIIKDTVLNILYEKGGMTDGA